ncbi:MAG: hypothetical protein ACT4O3_00890 [Elusimicrobiota bacterium]
MVKKCREHCAGAGRFVARALVLAWPVLLASAALGPLQAAPFDREFWKHWGDGRAELAGYDLVYPRYGELRRGTAVLIYVTEPFSKSLRVKADPGRRPKSDEVPVLKLNAVLDFPTGVYDYNLMTSAFVALKPLAGRPAGSPAKASFTSQEWCGHVYGQLLFGSRSVRHDSHSYFDGEADRREELPYPPDGVSEDILFLWARGLAAPFLAPGERREGSLLLSLAEARLGHKPLSWEKASFSRRAEPVRLQVPAGSFAAEVYQVETVSGRRWTFYKEAEAPGRLLKWEAGDGQAGELVASERMAYWEMNGEEFLSAVRRLGLSPRPRRTP